LIKGYTKCLWHRSDRSWPERGDLWEYVRDRSVYVCPTISSMLFLNARSTSSNACRHTGVKPIYTVAMNTHLGLNKGSYWVDGVKTSGGSCANGPWGIQKPVHYAARLDAVPEPDTTLLFTDVNTWEDVVLHRYRTGLDDPDFRASNPSIPCLDGIASAHRRSDGYLGKGTVVFVDGHVEMCVPEDAIRYAWADYMKRY
ncbi:MAG: hypothetical protein D6820_03095, partial [Lentisphaerae bacterium]